MKKIYGLLGFMLLLFGILGCTTMGRSAQEVFDGHHHMVETLGPDEAGLIAADYAEDAIFILADGTKLIGKGAIEAAFKGMLEAFPGITFTETISVAEGDTVLVMWSGYCDTGTFSKAIDTFIIRNGKIQRQTAWFEFVPKE